MPKYGLISETDGRTIEKTIDLLREGDNYDLNITEIGLFNCETSKGIYEYLTTGKKFYNVNYTGIDNEKDKPIEAPEWMRLIIGNSNEVYNQLEDNSQDLILVDGNHSFPYVISDYYCYRDKIKKGGFFCFHDVAPQAQGRDWQRIGDEKDPDMSISVIKALNAIGIMEPASGWECIFINHDPNDKCGGIASFKKLY